MNNPGNIASEPIITVTGTGEITLIVDMTIVELSDMNGDITIDSVLQEAYSGVESMNNRMSGDFPTLSPGNSTISWTGNVTYLTVTPNWRYL
jgi:phage-related protein